MEGIKPMKKDFSNIFLITDLDDTLLSKDKQISAVDLSSLQEFVARGGDFAVATGRVYMSAMPYLKRLPITKPCILYNGGVIYDYLNDKMMWKSVLPSLSEHYVIEILEKFPQIGAEILVDNDIFIPQTNHILDNKMVIENVKGIYCNIDQIPKNWIKVLFTVENELIPEISKFVSNKNFTEVNFVESYGFYFEMLPKNISKGFAIEKMMDIIDLTGLKLVACGDYNNDITMIKMADVGVCVSNSPEEVKDSADIVLSKTSEENAISELLELL